MNNHHAIVDFSIEKVIFHNIITMLVITRGYLSHRCECRGPGLLFGGFQLCAVSLEISTWKDFFMACPLTSLISRKEFCIQAAFTIRWTKLGKKTSETLQSYKHSDWIHQSTWDANPTSGWKSPLNLPSLTYFRPIHEGFSNILPNMVLNNVWLVVD